VRPNCRQVGASAPPARYRAAGGSSPALTDLIGERLDYTFDGVSTSLGYIQAGTIRLLGVAAPDRSPVLPGEPTIAESGLPGFDGALPCPYSRNVLSSPPRHYIKLSAATPASQWGSMQQCSLRSGS